MTAPRIERRFKLRGHSRFAQTAALPHDQSRAVAWVNMTFLLPALYGPALSEWVLKHYGETAFFVVAAIPAALAGLLMRWHPQSKTRSVRATGYLTLLRTDRQIWKPALAMFANGLAHTFLRLCSTAAAAAERDMVLRSVGAGVVCHPRDDGAAAAGAVEPSPRKALDWPPMLLAPHCWPRMSRSAPGGGLALATRSSVPQRSPGRARGISPPKPDGPDPPHWC